MPSDAVGPLPDSLHEAWITAVAWHLGWAPTDVQAVLDLYDPPENDEDG